MRVQPQHCPCCEDDRVPSAPQASSANACEEDAPLVTDCPDEVLRAVLGMLPPKDVAAAAASCRRLRSAAEDDYAWKHAAVGCGRWPGVMVGGSYRASVMASMSVDSNWRRHRFKRQVSHTHSSYIHAVRLHAPRSLLLTGCADGNVRAVTLDLLHHPRDLERAPMGASNSTGGAGRSGSGDATPPRSPRGSDAEEIHGYGSAGSSPGTREQLAEGCASRFTVGDADGEVTSVTFCGGDVCADVGVTAAGGKEVALWDCSQEALGGSSPSRSLRRLDRMSLPSSLVHAVPSRSPGWLVSGVNSSLGLPSSCQGRLPGVLTVLDVARWGAMAAELEVGQIDVYGLAGGEMSGAGAAIAGACGDGYLRLWDARASSSTVNEVRASRRGAVRCCSSGGHVLAVGAADGTLRLFDLRAIGSGASDNALFVNRVHDDVVNVVKYRPEMEMVLTGGDDGKVCILHERTRRCHVLHTERVGVLGLDFEHARVVLGAEDSALRVYDMTVDNRDSTFHDHEAWKKVRHVVALRQATRGLVPHRRA